MAPRIPDIIETMKEYIMGEPVESDDDREEYFDRLGLQGDVDNRQYTGAQGNDAEMGPDERNDLRQQQLSRLRAGTNPYDGGVGWVAAMQAPTITQFRTYSGEREMVSQKMLSPEAGERLRQTENNNIWGVIMSSVDVQMKTMVNDLQTLIWNLCMENSDRLSGARGHGSRMLHGAIDLLIHGYFLRMQDFMNFGYYHEIRYSPERFGEMLHISVFTVINGDRRVCDTQIDLNMIR